MAKVLGWTFLAVLAVSNTAWAQIIDVGSNRGPNGTHFDLSSNTGSFTYEGYCEASLDFELTLKVRRSGVILYSNTVTVINPPSHYDYCPTMDMSTWSLTDGQLLSFELKGKLLSYPLIRDTDLLYGDVTDPAGFENQETPWSTLVAALPARREDRYEELA